MKHLSVWTAAAILVWSCAALAQDETAISSEDDKISYALGTQIGKSLDTKTFEFNKDLFLQGIEDSRNHADLKLSQQEIQSTIQAFSMKLREEQTVKAAAEAEENKTEGAAFLAANKSKEGVKTTESGLQYKVITEGSGEKPAATDTVSVHYRGRLIDGTEFDSSYERGEPARFPVNGVIKGWTEALQLMPVGSKWELYIPSDLAYGEKGRPQIPPSSVLLFDVELLEIVK